MTNEQRLLKAIEPCMVETEMDSVSSMGEPPMILRGFSLTQPWASLVAHGVKQYETRSWSTPYRGTLAIQAAKLFPHDCRAFADHLHSRGILPPILPRSAILCLVDVLDCQPTETVLPMIDEDEESFGDYGPERFAIRLGNLRVLRAPVECKGALGLWKVPDDVITMIEQMTR